jgi:hypothetical protein
VFAVRIVGEKRRILAGSSRASLALTAWAAAFAGKKPKVKFKMAMQQTILIDNSFLGSAQKLCNANC